MNAVEDMFQQAGELSIQDFVKKKAGKTMAKGRVDIRSQFPVGGSNGVQLENDAVTPAQYFGERAGFCGLMGEADLCFALVEDALRDVNQILANKRTLLGIQGPQACLREFLKTLAWIDGAEASITFSTACWACGIDDERLRQRVKTVLRKAWAEYHRGLIDVQRYDRRWDRGDYEQQSPRDTGVAVHYPWGRGKKLDRDGSFALGSQAKEIVQDLGVSEYGSVPGAGAAYRGTDGTGQNQSLPAVLPGVGDCQGTDHQSGLDQSGCVVADCHADERCGVVG